MNNEITNYKGELDANKLFNKMQSLNSALCDLEKEAEKADILPSVNTKGALFWKREEFNSEKVEKLGQNAYAQAVIMSQLYDVQMQAMQLSVGSFDAIKTVNKELTKAMKIGFSEAGANNQALFGKTQEQIKRIAIFAKNYADNFEELKKELNKNFEKYLTKYDDGVERKIKNSLKDYATKNEIEDIKKTLDEKLTTKLERFEENFDSQISEIKDNYIKNKTFDKYKEDINDLKNNIRRSISKDEVKGTVEEKSQELENSLRSQCESIDNKLTNLITQQKTENEKDNEKLLSYIDEKLKEINSRLDTLGEQHIGKPKLTLVSILGLVMGAIGTILGLLLIFKIL